jgi:hypothetical protein
VLVLLSREEDDREGAGGLGRPGGGAGPALVAARVRPGGLAPFFIFFVLCFVLTLFSILQVCFEFGFETNSIYFASDNIFRS